ncbi:MAG: hypothetical protein KDB80_02765 [Planctomycetes bacterium]|nr:hypothetical protein [Planctomycetota bacterium]
MDIGKIHGPNPLHGGHDRARSVKNGDAAQGKRGLEADVAHISDASRETFDAVEALSDKARGHEGDRADVVAAAKARLEAGELDGAAVYEAVARKLLG